MVEGCHRRAEASGDSCGRTQRNRCVPSYDVAVILPCCSLWAMAMPRPRQVRDDIYAHTHHSCSHDEFLESNMPAAGRSRRASFSALELECRHRHLLLGCFRSKKRQFNQEAARGLGRRVAWFLNTYAKIRGHGCMHLGGGSVQRTRDHRQVSRRASDSSAHERG